MGGGSVDFPFIPEHREVHYVELDNVYMQAAKEAAEESLNAKQPVGGVLVQDGEIIGTGANGSTYHEEHGCDRKRLNIPTGEGYELCEGCHPKNHCEPQTILDAEENGLETAGADFYLYGHWWCCEPCWESLDEAGVEKVYLLEESWKLFNADYPENILDHL